MLHLVLSLLITLNFFSMLTKHRPFQFKVNSSQFVSIQPRKEKKVSVC